MRITEGSGNQTRIVDTRYAHQLPCDDGGSAGECAGLVQSRAQFQSAAGQLQEDEDSRRTS